MTAADTTERKSGLTLVLWWLGILYALFMVAYPFLIGCGCGHGTEHTCEILQYLDTVGSLLFVLLLPAGLRLFRERENMVIGIAVMAMLPAVCSLLALCLPMAESLLQTFRLGDAAEYVLAVVLMIPMLPYAGLLQFFPAGFDEPAVYMLLMTYCLAVTAYAVVQYRRIPKEERKTAPM